MKIWTKFIGSSVVVAVLIASLTGGSALLVKEAEKSAEATHDKTSQALNFALHLEISLRDEILALKGFLLLDRNAADMIAYQKAMSSFLITLDKLERLIPESPQLAIIRRRHSFLGRLANGITDTPTSIALTQQDLKAITSFSKDIEFILRKLSDHIEQQDNSSRQKLANFKQTATVITGITIAITLFIFFVQFVLILMPVIRSIQKLQLGAASIGSGNLDYRLEIKTKDEIEQLACEFNQMAARLTEFYNLLEQKVLERTAELTKVNQSLEIEIAERKQVEKREREKAQQLEQAMQELQQTQAQLIQTEKMSSLGQLVAGVAHEINNPVNFIHGNINHLDQYIQDLLKLVELYQQYYPQPNSEIQEHIETSDIDFIIADLSKMLSSMKGGTERIRQIVLSLRNFSRLDEADMKAVDIHEGIESTLLILQNKLKVKPHHPAIKIIKEYGDLPLVSCYAGQLNQVFMNVISNAIDALEIPKDVTDTVKDTNPTPTIRICTELLNTEKVVVRIIDNGQGMTSEVKNKIFDPFFTTKPVGKGTGLGLSICYQIIEKHRGVLHCQSELGKGTEFSIEIPINLNQNTSNYERFTATSLVH